MRRWLNGLFLASTILVAPGIAAAEESSCREAFAAGPRLTREGRLLAARAALVRCSAADCPAGMTPLCAEDLRQLEGRIPSIVFQAVDDAGNDLPRVRVYEGLRLVTDALDGRAIEVDPGPHTYRFSMGPASTEVSVLVLEGQKARPVSSVLSRPRPPSGPSPQPEAQRPVPWWVFAAGGASLVTTGLFAGFGVSGLNRRSTLDACYGSCDPSAVDKARTDFLLADVFMIASAVGFTATLALYLLRPTVVVPRPYAGTGLDVGLSTTKIAPP